LQDQKAAAAAEALAVKFVSMGKKKGEAEQQGGTKVGRMGSSYCLASGV